MMKTMPPILLQACLLWFGAAALNAYAGLTSDQVKLLQDAAGWEYVKMSDSGIQTQHVCFDGKPHPDLCSARITLFADLTFTQETIVKGQPVPRQGTYTLEDDQLAFFDEFGTRDGPYTIEIDMQKKSLLMYTSAVRVELIARKALEDKKRKDAK